MRTSVVTLCLSLLLAGVVPAADSLNVRLIGRWDSLPDYQSLGVAVQGIHAFVADNTSGLRVISIADTVHPVEVGYYDTPGHAREVTVVDSLAYVSDGDSGLQVISVADPSHPFKVGQCPTVAFAWDVVVNGGQAYVADDSGLSVISVADPAHPSEIGRYDNRYGASGVAVAGDYAYIVNSEGLWVVSISDPTQPNWVGRYITSALGVADQGSYAYVAASAAGLRVVSIADPTKPVEVGCLVDTNNSAVRLTVSGNYVYVVRGIAPGAYGLRVISVADPANPVVVGYHYLGRNCVALSGGYAYVCNSYSFGILQFYGGGVEEGFTQQAASVKPRPTVVRGVLNLPRDRLGTRSELADNSVMSRTALLDISGRTALELHPGANDVSRLAPGVYFVRTEPTAVSLQPLAVTKVIVAR